MKLSNKYILVLIIVLTLGSFLICYPLLDITQAVVTMKLIGTVYNGSIYRLDETSGASTVSPTQKSFVTESAPLENYENNKSVIVLNDGTFNDEAMDGVLGDETESDVILKDEIMNDDIMRDDQIVIMNGTAKDKDVETVKDRVLIHDKACIQGPTVDDWQTVSENLTYVYSAHLNPDSSETRSGIHIVGSIMGVYTKQPKYSSLVSDYYCRVWARSQSQEETEVFTAHVTAITGRGYTFGL